MNCKICGNKSKAKGYCLKHYHHYVRHGKILERTTFDKNEIILFDVYAKMMIYNRKGMIIADTIIDLEDVNRISVYKWGLTNKYVGSRINGRIELLHRFIMKLEPDDILEIDHVNHDILDNRKINLRICSHKQNMYNCKLSKTSKSKISGVCWYKKDSIWQAQIMIDGQQIYLGRFINKEDAIEARRQAEKQYFGEFAFKQER